MANMLANAAANSSIGGGTVVGGAAKKHWLWALLFGHHLIWIIPAAVALFILYKICKPKHKKEVHDETPGCNQ